MLMKLRLSYVLYFVLWFYSVFSQPQRGTKADVNRLKFATLNTENGLLHNYILALHKDRFGFLWIGTYGGLHRYDGNHFQYFTNVAKDSNSLSNNNIHGFYEDKDYLWIATERGLNRYNPNNHGFKTFLIPDLNEKKGAAMHLRDIVEDKSHDLWLASYGGGLICMDKSGKIKKHFINTNEQGSLPSDLVNDVFMSRQQELWVGTEGAGLCRYDTVSKTFESVVLPQVGLEYTVTHVQEDEVGNLWVGTWRHGFFVWNIKEKRLLRHATQQRSDLPDNTVRQVLIRGQQVWLATSKGLSIYDRETRQFSNCFAGNNKQETLPINLIWTLLDDPQKGVWVGTFGGGLSCWDLNKNRFEGINSQSHCPLAGNDIRYLMRDSRGRLWICFAEGSLQVFKDEDYCLPLKNPQIESLKEQKFYSAFEDHQRRIWLCGVDGVFLLDPELHNKEHLMFSETAKVSGFSVYSIMQDSAQNIWLGGWNTGLIRVTSFKDPKLLSFKVYTQKEGLPSEIIWKIYKDRKGRIWVSTNNGLVLFDEKKESFITVQVPGRVVDFEEQGDSLWMASNGAGLYCLLPNGTLMAKSIVPASINKSFNSLIRDGNQLWLGAQSGLLRYDITKDHYSFYTKEDGLLSNSFYMHAACQTLDGSKLLLGTSEGIVTLRTSDFKEEVPIPKAIITDIKLFDQSISLEHASHPLLQLSLFDLKHIALEYDQNFLSFELSALGTLESSTYRYSYFLEGFDQKPNIQSVTNSVASYTNLPPGEYVFRLAVKTVAQGLTGKEYALKIHISPPFWQTWWFRLIMIISLGLVLYMIYHWRTRMILARNRDLAHEVALRTRDLQEANSLLTAQHDEVIRKSERILEQQQQLMVQKTELEQSNILLRSSDNLKNTLFSAISHDIKNPVQNFMNLIQLAQSTSPKELPEVLGQAEQQARFLGELTQSLLDWSVFQGNKSDLAKEPVQIVEVCKDVIAELRHQAQQKQVTLVCEVSATLHTLCDRNALRTIIRNLCLNAIKFSHSHSKVYVKAGLQGDEVWIHVIDHGQGIEAEKLPNLFRFETQKKTRGTAGEIGAGIGLVFSYELNKLNGGELLVTSEYGKGATFTIKMPSHYVESPHTEVSLDQELILSDQYDIQTKHKDVLQGKVVFLVDDDDTLRNTLNRYLCDLVEIYEFPSAEEAWKKVQEYAPDLMIIDLNMDGMSGFEFTKLVKSTESTSHIACMILTGESKPERIAQAFEFGVDAYLTKPFDRQLLVEKMGAYFQQQKNKIKRYLLDVEVDVASITDNPINKAFLEKLVKTIEERLADSDLNAELLCDELGMSRSSLYRKLDSLTDQSVNDFIRNIRLKKGLELIKERRLNISQVAYEVGFNSLSYFTSSFKKHFGFSPSEVLEKRVKSKE